MSKVELQHTISRALQQLSVAQLNKLLLLVNGMSPFANKSIEPPQKNHPQKNKVKVIVDDSFDSLIDDFIVKIPFKKIYSTPIFVKKIEKTTPKIILE